MSLLTFAYPVCLNCGHIHDLTARRPLHCANCRHLGTLTFKRSHPLAFETSELIRRQMLAS